MQAIAILVFLAPEPVDAAARQDIGRLDGTWVVTAAEYKGKKVDRPPLERVVFAGGKARDGAAGLRGSKAFTYALGPGKTPKVIEATAAGEAGNGQRMTGLYEVGGDTLRLCLTPGGAPPAGFRTGADAAAILLELRREKR
jgi:uncharacterized protein (TIGR03067 family)